MGFFLAVLAVSDMSSCGKCSRFWGKSKGIYSSICLIINFLQKLKESAHEYNMFSWLKDASKEIRKSGDPRWALLGLFVAGLSGFAKAISKSLLSYAGLDWAKNIIEGYDWQITIWVGLIFSAWWGLNRAIKLRRQIEGAYIELAELRGTGASLRNDMLKKFSNDEEFKLWEKKALGWNDDVQHALRKINVATSLWFSRLDTVPRLPRVEVPNMERMLPKQQKLIREHDRRLHNLGRLIRDLWGIGEVHAEDIAK